MTFRDEDAKYLYENLSNSIGTDICIIQKDNSLYRLSRGKYSPDESGVLKFKCTETWVDNAFSVAEMQEIIRLYAEKVREVLFSKDSEVYKIKSVKETELFGREYFVIMV